MDIEKMVLQSGENVFKEYFRTADVVVLAEDKMHGIYEKEICAFLDQFNTLLNGVCIEFSPDIQKSFDTYIHTGVVDFDLENVLRGAFMEGKDIRLETLSLLDKARQYKLPIICFDARKEQSNECSKRSPTGGVWFIRGETRDEDMYTNIADYVTQFPGKYLVIVGAGHISAERFNGIHERFGPLMKKNFGEKCSIVKLTHSPDEKGGIYDDVYKSGGL